ncbi:sulfotransferase family protein [Seongchinamella sediminis]|nr:sulfotransferase [Seongchinamella sediminis]
MPILRTPSSPVFILGTGRSGTTILGIVLSMNKDVGFLNEPKAIWAALRDDEDLIGSYHRDAARYRLGAVDVSPELKSAAHRIYGSYLRFSMTRRIVDKYPELIFRVPFVRKIFPDAKFIFLSRNGWDTCCSIDDWSTRLGTQVDDQNHDWWGVNRRKWNLLVNQIIPEHADLSPHVGMLRDLKDQKLMAATEWIVTMREGMRLLESYPDDVMHVHYESLCDRPATVCKQIAEFAGLTNDAVFLEYAEKVLIKPERKAEFDLPPALQTPFRATIGALAELGDE